MEIIRIVLVIVGFCVEVAIPFIAVPTIPLLIEGCSTADSVLIGMGISIFLAVWCLTRKIDIFYDNMKKAEKKIKRRVDNNGKYLSLGFKENRENMIRLETLLKFEKELSDIQGDYFRKNIYYELENAVSVFKKKNAGLLEGYVETSPYEKNTFGIEGIKGTKNRLYYVSSIKDYWERTEFVRSYLDIQYDLIQNQSVIMKRIFIGDKKILKKMKNIMKEQADNGIKVYYIDSSSEYCPNEWKEEDFLIQDDSLVVILQSKSHKADQGDSKEIITTKKALVDAKIQLFNNMLNNAKEWNKVLL